MGANKSTLTLMGLYNYDDTLFDNLQLPEDIDRETAINNIIMECAELEVIYPSFEFMRFSIGVWSAKELPVWNKLQETTKFKYNPIWNKDGVITEKETHENNIKDVSHSDISGGSHADNVATSQVSAYDSDDFVNRDKNSVQSNMNNSAESDSNATRNDTGNVTRERVEQGNIGITTTQQMINEEREVVKFNIIDYITQSFRNRFCLLVY